MFLCREYTFKYVPEIEHHVFHLDECEGFSILIIFRIGAVPLYSKFSTFHAFLQEASSGI